MIAQLAGGDLEITDFSTGWGCRAEGTLAHEIRAFLSTGVCCTALSALGTNHPIPALLDRLRGESRRLLTPAAALELDGFDTLFLELTGRCNERCIHCYAGSSPHETTSLDRQACEEVLQDAARLGFRLLQFTGGDPLLCPFLPELAGRAARLGIPAREIYTNGLLLCDTLLDRLAAFEVRFAFSFYSLHPHVHDAITRTPGSQQRTLAAIRRALARDLRVRVSVIVMAENASHVDATVSYLESLGVAHVGVAGSRPVGRGHLFAGQWASGGAHRLNGGVKDRHGTLCVASDGRVLPCIFNRTDTLGRVPEQRLSAIARHPRRLAVAELTQTDPDERRRRALQCVSCQATAHALRTAQCCPGPAIGADGG